MCFCLFMCCSEVPLKSTETLYMTAVKALIGARTAAPDLLCLSESVLPLGEKKQAKFSC